MPILSMREVHERNAQELQKLLRALRICGRELRHMPFYGSQSMDAFGGLLEHLMAEEFKRAENAESNSKSHAIDIGTANRSVGFDVCSGTGE